jgi:DNA primase
MIDSRPNFRLIKERVSMLDVLARYKIELRAKNQHKREGKCPLPQHGNRDGKPSFHVDFTNNVWVWACHEPTCKEVRGGKKKGGDLIEFVAFMEKCSLRQSGEYLDSWFGPFENAAAAPETPKASVPNATPSATNPPLGFELQGIDHAHPYLQSRGFDEEECAYLGIGYFPGKGSMSGRVVFPIRNRSGELVGYAGRVIDDSLICEAVPRWKFPAGFKRGSDLFNLHDIEGDSVVVCESFWGVVACVRAGIFNAVAVMSSEATEAQVRMLSTFREVLICLDGDSPGRDGAQKLGSKLRFAGVKVVEVKTLAAGVQPDHLTPDTLRVVLGIPAEPEGFELVEDHPYFREALA